MYLICVLKNQEHRTPIRTLQSVILPHWNTFQIFAYNCYFGTPTGDHCPDLCIQSPSWLTHWRQHPDLCIQSPSWFTHWTQPSRSMHTVAILAHSLETIVQIHAQSQSWLTGDKCPDLCIQSPSWLTHRRQPSRSMHTVAIFAHSLETTVQMYAYSHHLGSLTGDSCPDLCIQSPSWITDYKQLPGSIQHHHGSLTRYYCPMES